MSAPIFHDEPPDTPLAELGRYARLADARERGLVVAAMELPHWIIRQGRGYVLCVEEKERDRALAALAEFEREEAVRVPPPEIEPLHVPWFAVMMSLLVMVALYVAQRGLPSEIIERGVADNVLIRAGEWWRVVTALTLHGDMEHLLSNLSLAIFVFAFVLWRFGVGIGVSAIVLGGALGNTVNALMQISQHHRSIGSSTALLAGLGLLAGAELAARLAHRGTTTGWPLMVPIGAGMAFLSMFGGGGGQNRDGTPVTDVGNVDLGAHLFGLLAGIAVGAVFFAIGMKRGAKRWLGIAAGAASVALLAGSWLLAR
jgi:rhomboid protease GluP